MTRMILTAADRWQFLGLLIIAVVVGWNAYFALSLDRRDPVAGPLFTEALNSPIAAGDVLRVRITRDKIRGDCPVRSDRRFVSEDGRTIATDLARHIGGSPNQAWVDWAYPTPRDLSVGSYELRVYLTYQCPGGLQFDHIQEPVRFRVTEDRE